MLKRRGGAARQANLMAGKQTEQSIVSQVFCKWRMYPQRLAIDISDADMMVFSESAPAFRCRATC